MSTPARQLTFNLSHRPAHGRADFLVAPSNWDAVAWIDMWPDWPAPVLIIHGPAACGKSHLAAVWKERANAINVAPVDLIDKTADEIFMSGAHFVIDPVDPWIGDKVAETTLFHLYNMARENGKTMLLTMRAAPIYLGFALPDLASRLRAAPSAGINAPGDTLLGAVMVKMFSDRQITITQDILDYILPRMVRSFAAARDLVERADALALEEKRAVSVPLLRRILSENQGA